VLKPIHSPHVVLYLLLKATQQVGYGLWRG